MKRKISMLCVFLLMAMFIAGCGNASTKEGQIEVQVFIAASLSDAMEEVALAYNKDHPNVKLVFHADSSGTLMTQIKEGYDCDVYFSASAEQMDLLEQEGFLEEGTRADLLNNQLVVITYEGSDTAVTGLSNMKEASSIAMADESVPVGKYTRQALVALGILNTTEESLPGVEISEQSNVSKVLSAVIEHSCEVGTVYLSDTYGREDEIEILEIVDESLTGKIIYPVAQIKNSEAEDEEVAAAKDFILYLTSDEAKAIFKKHLFDTSVD